MDLTKLEQLPTVNNELDAKYGVSGTASREQFNQESVTWFYENMFRQHKKRRNMNKLILAALAAVLGLASCSSESDGPAEPVHKQILGHIEKGPFVQGSEVTLTDLNRDLSQTGKVYSTNTTSDLGQFDFGQTLALSSGLVELKTAGYFYNECTGALSNSQISLKAIADTEGANNLNVNLLTHLEYDRVKYLVKAGQSFRQAKEQAEREILKTFAITDKIVSPERVSLTDNNKSANILLAVSSIMLYDKTEAEFSEFIAKFSGDLEKDGTIDDLALKETIKEGQKNCRPSEIRERTEAFYQAKGSNVTIGDFSSLIDFNGDGVIDDRDGEYIEVLPTDSIVEEDFFITEDNVKAVLAGTYAATRDYVLAQNELDAMRVSNERLELITPWSDYVTKAWTCGFTANARALMLIKNLENRSFSFDTKPYVAQAKALRAFVLYNMATEWGRIPVINDVEAEGAMNVAQSDADAVYNLCLDMTDGQMPFIEQDTLHFTQAAADVLRAEIYLTLGRASQAKQILQTLPAGDVFRIVLEDGKAAKLALYSADYIAYLKDEAEGADNSAGWFAHRKNCYGTFAALRRLNKVQALTGIDRHYNLLPIPGNELSLNPNLTQTPGY